MQKMMFNDKYGLTEAVLNGRGGKLKREEYELNQIGHEKNRYIRE